MNDDARNFFRGVLYGVPVGTLLWLVAALLLIAGCTLHHADPVAGGPGPWRIENITRTTVMVLDAPTAAATCADLLKRPGPFCGCIHWRGDEHMILTSDSARCLLHELMHVDRMGWHR